MWCPTCRGVPHEYRTDIDVVDPQDCPTCGETGHVPPQTLLVGERFNKSTYKPRLPCDPARQLDILLRMGAFHAGADRLLKIGVEWDAAVNLSWPDPQGVKFDKATADVTAGLLKDYVVGKFDCVILAGANVQRCFGFADCAVPQAWLDIAANHWWFLTPHPSGLSRVWNDARVAGKVADAWAMVVGYYRSDDARKTPPSDSRADAR